ncbi:hypothetical protein [Naasia aerilata]|uniref:hypothetical protein n=1 Tax=Naasia aerilata TaxID=1162966 RepID=UPI002572C5F6|nr:hypothetical protein [Naasia aerilata]
MSLVRKSLVSVQANDTGVRRFRLLDSVRRYLRSRHPASDPDAWLARHLDGTRRFVARQGRRSAPPATSGRAPRSTRCAATSSSP